MFEKFNLTFDSNSFGILSKSAIFENITRGRLGTTLIDNINGTISLVRTTTKYNKPAQSFQQIHYDIINKIKDIKNDAKFNNALIEIYDDNYVTMGYHSDMALDLADNSNICLFSCYENQSDTNNYRRLRIKQKNTDTEKEEDIVLDHNSIVIFSMDTNSKLQHKIILENNNSKLSNNSNNSNKWCGLTLRLSKTFIKFINETPYFVINNTITNNILKFASNEETKEFYIYRGKENKLIDFKYPELYYTISKSDLLNFYTIGLR